MRKALACAEISVRLYMKSGRIALPLLVVVGFPLIFFYVLPVQASASFSITSVGAFVFGAWVGLSYIWSESDTLRQIFIVKVGLTRYEFARHIRLFALGAVGGLIPVLLPLLAHAVYLPNMFAEPLTFTDAALAFLLNIAAGLSGTALGSAFHPRLIRDRKLAYLACIILFILGLVGGGMGLPLPVRLLLPPLYDPLFAIGAAGKISAAIVLPFVALHLAYAALCTALQLMALRKNGE